MTRISRFTLALALFMTGAGLHWAMGQEPGPGRTHRVNDIEMYYEVRGTGEPLLLLHGFGGCGQDWQPFVGPLAERYRLVIPDLRGHGWSTNPSGTFTHRQAALDVLTLLDRLGVQRIRAMGISSGGMTLLHVATQQPKRVEAMVLIGATIYFPEQAREFMRLVARDSIPAETRGWFHNCARRGEAQARWLMRQFGSFKDSYDDVNFTAPYLSTISARTLIVHGDRDEFFPVSIPVEMYQAIPHSALWIIPQGRHVPIFGAHANEFQNVVIEFLRGGAGQRP